MSDQTMLTLSTALTRKTRKGFQVRNCQHLQWIYCNTVYVTVAEM